MLLSKDECQRFFSPNQGAAQFRKFSKLEVSGGSFGNRHGNKTQVITR
jgi:hypothetical protein